MSTLVSAAFWILFPIGCLLSALCLAGIFLRGSRLTAARWHLDDGMDSGPGYEIYRLTIASGRLGALATAVGLLHAATLLVGVLGTGGLRIAALLVSAFWVLAADCLRERHARLEQAFERETGEPLDAFHRRLRDGEATAA